MSGRLARTAGIVALLLLALLGGGAAHAQAVNPLTGRPAERPAPVAEPAPAREPGLWTRVAAQVFAWQRQATRAMSRQMAALKEGASPSALAVALSLGFAYGAVHAIGPGHGKLVVVSYFVGHRANAWRGLRMGAQIAAAHVVSAVVIVLLAQWILSAVIGSPLAEQQWLRLASYGTIALIGLAMLGLEVRRTLARRAGLPVAEACCGHRHGDSDRHAPGGRPASPAREGLLSLAVGIVPCTGAVLVLLYALANDMLALGLLVVAAISVGMAGTLAALGIAAILSRRVALAAAAPASPAGRRLGVALDYAGALGITAIGGLLLAGSLAAP